MFKAQQKIANIWGDFIAFSKHFKAYPRVQGRDNFAIIITTKNYLPGVNKQQLFLNGMIATTQPIFPFSSFLHVNVLNVDTLHN